MANVTLDLKILMLETVDILKTFQWVFPLLIIIIVAINIKRFRTLHKQKYNEGNILNLFNEDGGEKIHWNHKRYEFMPSIFAIIIIVLIWILVNVF